MYGTRWSDSQQHVGLDQSRRLQMRIHFNLHLIWQCFEPSKLVPSSQIKNIVNLAEESCHLNSSLFPGLGVISSTGWRSTESSSGWLGQEELSLSYIEVNLVLKAKMKYVSNYPSSVPATTSQACCRLNVTRRREGRALVSECKTAWTQHGSWVRRIRIRTESLRICGAVRLWQRISDVLPDGALPASQR